MSKQTESKETESKVNTDETEAVPLPSWNKGDTATHGHSEYDLFGVNGLWREKGCNEIGGMKVRIYLSARADAPICNRPDKHTVVITGVHEGGETDINVSKLQKHGAANRKEALKLARHPASWSKKAQVIVDKIAEAKAKAEEEANAETEPKDSTKETVEA